MARGALVAVLLVSGVARAEQGWDFAVTLADPEVGALDVDWTLRGFDGPVRVCADMPRGARGVARIEQLSPGEKHTLPRDEACWTARAEAGQPLRLRYRYDLVRMSGQSGDPDYVSRVDDSYVFNDESVLLRPDPLPKHAPIAVEFHLPEGYSVAAPWKRLEGPGLRFRYDSEQYDAGSYVALGKLHSLGEVKVRGGVGAITMIERPREASDELLRWWIGRALTWVADFYQGLPGGRVHVVLVPTDSSRGAVYGTTLRRGMPSIAVYFGARANKAAFAADWVVPHELFHIGNPATSERLPWLSEGFTTYYQEVLMARGGAKSSVDGWSALYEGFEDHCQPEGGRSLAKDSANLRRTYRFSRVYWGGACLAFRLDVAIRERGNRDGLDGVMRELRRRGLEAPLDEDEVIEALDAAAGRPLAREHLDAVKPNLPLDALYRHLGLEPTGSDTVLLRDDAPEAAIRRSIF